MKKYILILGFIAVSAVSQAQCLVNSLIVNTAYDPVTGLTIPYGLDGAPPVTDPKWMVTSVTAAIAPALPLTLPSLPFGSALFEVMPGNNADVIEPAPGGWIANPPGNPGGWISCLNGKWYVTDITSDYNMTLGREFKTCIDDNIKLDFYIANDDWISASYIDCTPLSFSQPTGFNGSNYSTFSHFTQTVFLPAGTHTINFVIHNYNFNPPLLGNATGMDLYGTVSSSTGLNSLVSESNPACSAHLCAISCDMLFVPDTIHACAGGVVALNDSISGPDSVISYNWSPSAGLSSTSVLSPMLTVGSSPATYYLTVLSLIPYNMVANGDFCGGSIGFTTAYNFIYPGPTSAPPSYAVVTDPSLYNGAFPSFGDHTSGTGNMLLVDGAGVASMSFWSETINTITPNTDYLFTAWIALAHTPTPTAQLTINSVPVGTFTCTSVGGAWVKYQTIWNSGPATSAVLSLQDLNTMSFGNDFVVDDISFQQLCTVRDSVYVTLVIPDSTHFTKDTSACLVSGSVTLSASRDYTSYIWNTGATTSSIGITSSGTYYVVAYNGCAAIKDTFNVTLNLPPVVSLGADTTICAGAKVTIRSPQPFGYNYSWSTGSRADTIIVSAAGDYWLSVNGNGCTTTDTMHLSVDVVHAGISISPDTLCEGDVTVLTDASTATTAIAGHYWTLGDGGTDITAGPLSHTYPTNGIYPVTLRVTDAFGCIDSLLSSVVALRVEINSFHDTTLCISQPLPLTNVVSFKPNIPLNDNFKFLWQPATYLSDTTSQIPDFFGVGVTTYTLVATLSHYGCSATDIIRITAVPATPLANVTVNTTIAYGANVQLNADSEVYYLWKPNDGSLNNANISDPVATPQHTTTYIVYGFDKNGCMDTASVVVHVDSNLADCIPSAFTPNSDGLNDIFRPACNSFQKLVDFRIFNRWGAQVFYSSNYKQGWDGSLNGEPQDLGVYFYMITVAKPGGENVIYKGDVTLIR